MGNSIFKELEERCIKLFVTFTDIHVKFDDKWTRHRLIFDAKNQLCSLRDHIKNLLENSNNISSQTIKSNLKKLLSEITLSDISLLFHIVDDDNILKPAIRSLIIVTKELADMASGIVDLNRFSSKLIDLFKRFKDIFTCAGRIMKGVSQIAAAAAL